MNEREKHQARTSAAKRFGLAGPEKVDLVVLPTMEVRMQPVTRERKDELAESIDAEFYARSNRAKVPQAATPLDDASISAVCETCRGACCKAGENHAFLTRAVLARVKAEQRIATNASLLEAYLDRVPQNARKGSCIYHGAQGCPLKQLGKDFSRAGYAQLAVSTVAGDEGEARMLLLRDGEVLPVRPESSKLESLE